MNAPITRTQKNSAGPGFFPQLPDRSTRFLLTLLLIGVAALFILTAPASAGEKYMSGSPVLSVSIGGTNEFTPGQEVQIPVIVDNSGLNQYKFVNSGIVTTDDVPNTAKFLTVTLGAGSTPLIIKTDPQMLGNLPASSSATGTFTVRIPSDTPSGTYNLPVKLNYTYLYQAEQFGTDTIQYYYKTKEETFSLPITIKPDVRISIVNTDISGLNAATEGSIQLEVKNIGHENAKKAIITIAQNDGSPIVPTEGSAYIGDFPAGSTATARFKATVSSSADAQTYPLDVYVKYENNEGDTITSEIETIGIPVGKKTQFIIVSDPETILPGQKKVITVRYKNIGDAIAYHATARVSLVNPFSSSDDNAYLGDVAPGEVREAAFLISAEGSATPKQYGIDSEVRFNDIFDNQIVSDPIKLGLIVEEKPGFIAGILQSPVALGILALLVIGIGFGIYRKYQSP
jgi:hypothetical protein